MSSSNSTFVYKSTHHEEPQALEFPVWWIQPVTVDEFMRLDGASRHYRRDDITRVLDWFNHAQTKCGIGELVELAVKSFAREIATSLGLLPPATHSADTCL